MKPTSRIDIPLRKQVSPLADYKVDRSEVEER